MFQNQSAILAFPATDLVVNTHIDDAEPDVLTFQPVEATDAEPDVLTPEASPFYDSLAALAVKYIKKFFANKSAYYGGLVDRRLVTKKHFVDLVLSTTLEKGVQEVYDHWHPTKRVSLRDVRMAAKTGDIPGDIEAVIAILNECASLGVPKCFAGGICVMYFEFCEGFDFAPDALTFGNVAC